MNLQKAIALVRTIAQQLDSGPQARKAHAQGMRRAANLIEKKTNAGLEAAVAEYVEARNAYEEAKKPNGGFGQPKRLCHGDPIVLRYRNARAKLDALQVEP